MPRITRSVPVVILHGWHGSGPDHWQSLLAADLRSAGREVRYPLLPDPDAPRLAAWLAALDATLDGMPEQGYDLVAHSLGAVLWLHHAAGPGGTPRPARAVLVAPPSPRAPIAELSSFLPPPLDVEAVRAAAGGTILVAGDDDPHLPEGIADAYARPLKIATTVVPGGGHLNTESGFGPWPAMSAWCNRDSLAFY
ncbi:MAG: hypothetical protein EPN43_12665 [Jatrophihabitans sp.]|nr:MAG: hypothetical protein EPN43_12665 [Jatrophihabitans sp.]